MAKVLIFNNYYKPDDKAAFAAESSSRNEYQTIGPGRWAADLDSSSKHSSMRDIFRRIICCTRLVVLWRNFDVLIVESPISGFFVACISLLSKGKKKLMVSNFNVPQHRNWFWNQLARIAFSRIDHFIVHSRNDIDISNKLYNIPRERITFIPFFRSSFPATGKPDSKYLEFEDEPFVFSFGSNARDYKTFIEALENTNIKAIIVAKKYNIIGLSIPLNIKTYFDIPMSECDKLASKALFTVFTFNGTEPSCGQISIVTSFTLGKPVICTDWGGVYDYVKDRENGLLVKIRDANDLRQKIEQLYNDSSLYNKLSKGAKDWADLNGNLNNIQQNFDELINRICTA